MSPSTSDLLIYAQAIWANDQLRLAAILIGLAAIAFVVLPGGKRMAGAAANSANAQARAQFQRPVALPRVGNRGLLDRTRQRWIEPVTLSGRMVETKDKHIAIGATTGARKTTLVGNLIMQARRPVVYIAGDASPYAFEAMRARGWRVWTADGSNGGLYIFPGTPQEAAQIVTVLLYPPRVRTGTGLQLGMVRGVFRNAIQEMDDSGIQRSLPALADALYDAKPPRGLPSKNFDMAKVNWIARIEELADSLGPALGYDVDVLECVRSECGLGFDLNAFADMDLASDFGELAVRLTQHAADKTGDFWWIIDELALFDAALLGQIVRTCRIRRVKFVGASQIISDFGKTLRGLVKVWFVGEQTAADEESRNWCSHLTMGLVPPENFSEHATPPGFYYVVADGRIQDLQLPPWHHPSPSTPVRLLPAKPGEPGFIGPLEVNGDRSESWAELGGRESDSEGNDTEAEPRIEGPIRMPDVYRWAVETFKRNPRVARQIENIWLHHAFPGGLNGCYESTYHVNNRGRPSCSLDGTDWTTYILLRTLEDARLQRLDATGTMALMSKVKMLTGAGQLTVDHVEGCENEVCDRPDHLAWEGRGRNSELHWDRKRGDVAAD